MYPIPRLGRTRHLLGCSFKFLNDEILIFISFSSSLLFTSCDGDISAAMFAGGDGTYDFKNEWLDSKYHVDESKIHLLNFESDDDTVYSLYLGDFAQIATDTIIVYLHGNAASMDQFWQTAGLFANLGPTPLWLYHVRLSRVWLEKDNQRRVYGS